MIMSANNSQPLIFFKLPDLQHKQFSLIHSFINTSFTGLLQVQSLFQIEYSAQCDLVLPLPILVLPCLLQVTEQLLISSSSSHNVFQKAGLNQDGINLVNLPSLYCLQDIPFLLDTTHFFLSQMTGPNDLLHPYPAPHCKPFHVWLNYFLKYLNFKITHGYAPNVWHNFFLKF